MAAPHSRSQPWHQALVFALLGEQVPGLAEQESPDVPACAAWIVEHALVPRIRATAAAQRKAGQPWPLPLPDGLAVPPAQFAAAVYDLRRRLGLLGAPAAPAVDRQLSADELRLLRDVPPHHGH